MLRTLSLGVTLSALAAAASGAPAAGAPKADVAYVNGIPGKKVDICQDQNEVASKLRYGRKSIRKVGAGTKTITFRVAAPGKCTGKVLAKKKDLVILGTDDLTIVGTKKSPSKVLVFDDSALGPLPAAIDTAWAWRHAADIPDVGFSIGFAPIDIDLYEHAADIFWNKGDELVDSGLHDTQVHIMTMTVVLPFSEFGYAGPKDEVVYPGMRYEWIFLGTNEQNARITTIRRVLDV